jgi:hypothetical protein
VIGAARLWTVALLLPVALGIGRPADCVAASEQLVYWPLVTDGKEYRRIPYPQQAGAILVLADSEVVIEARRAPVSYWPITREYLADFAQNPEPVNGSLEIVDGSGETTVVEPEPYVVWYPMGVGAGPAELVHGQRTRTFYDGYLQAARSAAAEAKEYQRIVGAHQAAVEAWLRLAAERRGQDMPPPPPELDIEKPEPFHAYASEPREAAVLSLPEGTYTVRIRDADGALVPGSERELVSFAPLDRAIGYVLRPENRWTQPVISFAPDEVIYTTGETDLFFQPVPVVEYQARSFTRLFRPQSAEAVDASLTVWTPQEQRDGAQDGLALALWHGDALVDTLTRTPYRVAQLPRASRGYVIEEFAPQNGSALEPEFHAMRVDRALEVTQVGLLVDGAAGNPVSASIRQIREVDPPPAALLFLPALLPLAVGVALRIRWRRIFS